jgi:hypothetical protein
MLDVKMKHPFIQKHNSNKDSSGTTAAQNIKEHTFSSIHKRIK